MAKFKLLSAGGKGKGLEIFKTSAYTKDHERLTLEILFWRLRWIFGIWILTVLAFGLSFAIEHIWRYGFSPATFKWLSAYFNQLVWTGGIAMLAEIPAWLTRTVMRPDIPAIMPLIPIIIYNLIVNEDFLKEFNPHGKYRYDEKSSRKAIERDIPLMGRFGGLFKGFIIVLGKFKKKFLMLDETLSVLCVAPPGTGKTMGVVLPTIFKCDGVSMIINDPKPELDGYTSGYRAKIGPVFIINWAGQDDPSRGVYYPSWNPLSPEHVPFLQEKRDLYIDSICTILIADKASSTADPHWTISGRAALSGLVQFIVSKIERAKADDYFKSRLDSGEFDGEDAALLDTYYASMLDTNAEAARHTLKMGQMSAMNYVHVGTWAKIPPQWIGKEASLSMILDWLNTSQISITEDLEARRKAGDQMVMMADSMKELFLAAVEEARQYGYAHRSILELTQLANTPDKERGSILSTVMSGLSIFRNAAVRNRTSHSDFHFSDLRGIKDSADGKWKPISVYLSINLVDADALNPITAIFIELMSQFLLSNLPEAVHADQKLGPFPVAFILDEMPKMQKMQAVIQGPDLGRGQKVSYLIIGQNIHQISEKYGKDAAETIMSTTAAKIVFRQNDWDTAEKFSKQMGEKIEIKVSKDDKGKEKEDKENKGALYSPMDILKLEKDKQIIIMQGFANRPIEADTPYAFADDEMKELMKIPKSSPLPEFLIPAHHAAMGYPGAPVIKK
ncbi:MAG: type IV secretory system conjugative DNA transfer family protein [Rickettsiales bacterium]|jgi:type IV secretion system protein VirD4|nr:type IV secretory system conjugative DNA transfer family protein [Rickettsiales bacterium]